MENCLHWRPIYQDRRLIAPISRRQSSVICSNDGCVVITNSEYSAQVDPGLPKIDNYSQDLNQSIGSVVGRHCFPVSVGWAQKDPVNLSSVETKECLVLYTVLPAR